MRFAQYGRTYQLVIEGTADLRQVLDLDESHWVATSAPVAAFRCDPRFLALVDADGNGRITSEEVKKAIRWLLDHLADPGVIEQDGNRIPLAAIGGTDAANPLKESAKYMLESTSVKNGDSIDLRQVRDFIAGIQSRPMNGDGIIPPEAASDPEVAAFVRDVVAAGWGTVDSNGKAGVDEALVQGFQASLPAYLAWHERGVLAADQPASEVLPFGTATADLFALLNENTPAVEMFFRLCHVVQFDARASSRVGGADSALQALDPTDEAVVDACLGKLPIARPTLEARLPLSEGDVNPLYHGWLAAFRERIVRRVLGSVPSHLSESDWQAIRRAFAPYQAYLADKPARFTDTVPTERLSRYVQETHWADLTLSIIAADRRVARILEHARQVEQLILYASVMLEFVNNFVSFPYLYAADRRAMFEMGSVVLDGRWFHFAVKVDNVATHAAAAGAGDLFVMYLEVTGAMPSPCTVAVPVVSGTKGNITVGKRGVFFDIQGREFDARITKIVENPISLGEALAAPFVKLWHRAQGKIESWSSTAEKGLQSEFDKTVKAGAKAPASKPAAAASPAGTTHPSGFFLGMGVTMAAVGSAFAFITKTLSGMAFSHILYSFAGAALAVLLPVTLIAIQKLRRQDLSVLLEGCGWAVNARMRLHRRQRRQFNRSVPYPNTAEGIPRRRRLRTVLFLLLLIVSLTAIVRGYRSWKAKTAARTAPVRVLAPSPPKPASTPVPKPTP